MAAVTLPVWSSALPQAGRWNVTGGPQMNVVSFKPEVGPTIDRRRSSSIVRQYSIELPPMDATQYEVWQTWFHETLSDGVLPFIWVNPITKEFSVCKFIQSSDRGYDESMFTNEKVTVKFSLAVLRKVANSAFDALFGEVGIWVDFINDKVAIIRDDGIAKIGRILDFFTFTRATTATYVGSDKAYHSAAAGELRFDHDPLTGEALGALFEGARTNSVRNNSMQGGAAGTPGTLPTNWTIPNPSDNLTREIVGIGIENGIDYIDIRYSGTSGSSGSVILFAPENTTQISATSGQTWAFSTFLAIVGGSISGVGSVQLNMSGRDAGGSPSTDELTGSNIISQLSSVLARFQHTGTFASGTTARIQPRTIINFDTSAAIDITIRVGWPQLELGEFASSPIPTTSAAVTRNGDALTISVSDLPYSAAAGTLFCEASIPYINSIANIAFVSLNDGTGNENIFLHMNSGNRSQFSVINDGVSQVGISVGSGSPVSGEARRLAGAWTLNDCAFSNNGDLTGTDSVATVPIVTTLAIGARFSTAHLYGHVKTAALFPRRFSNSELQTLSAAA